MIRPSSGPSAWLRRSLTCSRCDVSSADLIILNSFGGGRFSGSLLVGWPQLVHNPLPGDLGGRDERHGGLVVIRAVVERDDPVDGDGHGRLARRAPPALVPWMTVLPNRIGTMLP